MRVSAQEEVGEKLGEISAVRHLSDKPAQAHPGLLTVGVPFPVHPTQVARDCLDCSGLVCELSALWEKLSTTVEIVKQGNATREVAEDHVELAVCGELIFILESRGREE